MDGLIGVERQKLPFTIENILSKYPNSHGDGRSCGTSGAGLKERAVSPAGGQTETVHRACLCCYYCSHCGDIFQTDFIHEGKTKPILFMRRVASADACFKLVLTSVTLCSLTQNQISSLQPVSTDGPQRCSRSRAGRGVLTERRRHPVRCRGEPGVTALFSQRSSWMLWRSCSCRTSIQMWTWGRN